MRRINTISSNGDILGGIVFNGRLFGQLALSRCLGDFNLKPYGLIVKPSFMKMEVFDGDYIVIASDGVWDVVNEVLRGEISSAQLENNDIYRTGDDTGFDVTSSTSNNADFYAIAGIDYIKQAFISANNYRLI